MYISFFFRKMPKVKKITSQKRLLTSLKYRLKNVQISASDFGKPQSLETFFALASLNFHELFVVNFDLKLS